MNLWINAFRSDSHSVDELNAIAKINQIYKNMNFLLKKERELDFAALPNKDMGV